MQIKTKLVAFFKVHPIKTNILILHGQKKVYEDQNIVFKFYIYLIYNSYFEIITNRGTIP